MAMGAREPRGGLKLVIGSRGLGVMVPRWLSTSSGTSGCSRHFACVNPKPCVFACYAVQCIWCALCDVSFATRRMRCHICGAIDVARSMRRHGRGTTHAL